MVELAISENSKLRASDAEFQMPKPSYTVDTLARLAEKYPQHEFKLIMGEDNLTQFQNWKNYEQILEFYELYVYPRPNVGEHAFKQHPKIKFVEAPLLDISATFIRQSIKDSKPIKYMVLEVVEEYIKWKKFYL